MSAFSVAYNSAAVIPEGTAAARFLFALHSLLPQRVFLF